MSSNNMDSFDNAVKQLGDLMKNLTNTDRQKLIVYAMEEWMMNKIGDNSESDSDDEDYEHNNDDLIDDPVKMMNLIAKELRQKLPFTGTTKAGDSEVVVNVLDAFMYEAEDVEELRIQKKIEINYCHDCQSKNIKPIKFISQSLSRDEVYQVYNNFLPTLDGKIVLDIASGIGAALYGAFGYTDAEKIIGLEPNKDLYELQKHIINKYKLEKRVQVINKRIEETPETLREADVILLTNLSENYKSRSEQVGIWNFLKENIKKRAYIVLCRSLKSHLEDLDVKIDVNNWVEKVEMEKMQHNFFNDEFEKLDESEKDDEDCTIFCYQVL